MNGHLSPLVPAEEGGRTLIVGSTGFIGRFVADASIESGRPTYLLVRCPSKASSIKFLQDKGATIIYGSIVDQDFMEKVLREYKIEFVISAVGGEGVAEQNSLIKAIKAVGNVKRFLPSEFGHDIDRADPVEPGLRMYSEKRRIRRCIEEAGIPYTYICCNSIAAWPYHDNTHPADVLPPLDCFHIYGDGSVKAYFVAGTDIGKFTIKSLDDERTLNKTVHFQPPSNKLNVNELASLWEEKIGRKLPRVCITEDDLLAAAKEMIIPRSVVAALTHDIFIKGCQINYSMNKLTDVEVCSLYPDTPLKTIDESFADFAAKVAENAKAVGAKLATTNVVLLPNNKPEAQKNGILVPNHKTEALPNTKPDSLANMMLAPNNKPEGLPNGISVPNNKPEALTNGILVANNKPEALPNSKPEALAITA